MSRAARRVAVVGMPGAGRTTLTARLVRLAVRGGPSGISHAKLPEIARELSLRGLRREDPSARPGSRTTRQILDAILKDGARGEGAPEEESLFLEIGPGPGSRGISTIVEMIDVAGARFENDAVQADPLHAFRSLERDAAGLLLVADAARWAAPDGPREAELDRTAAFLRRVAAGRASLRRPLRVALALVRRGEAIDAAPGIRRLRAAIAPAPNLDLQEIPVDGADDESLRPLLAWVLDRSAEPRPWRLPGRIAAAVGALALIVGGTAAAGSLMLRGIATEERLADAGAEHAFIDSAERTIKFWSRFPLPFTSAAHEGVLTHARYLETVLADHPAVAEPMQAVNLQAAQYRAAADHVVVLTRLLGQSPARDALSARLREKARTAEMPPVGLETLAAWEELWRMTADPALREGAIAPRLRPVEKFLLDEAERACMTMDRYPDLLRPLLACEAAHPPVCPDLLREAETRQWDRAVTAIAPRVLARPAGAEALLDALAQAPAPPPAAVRRRLGRMLGDALFSRGTVPPDLRARVLATCGPDEARGLVDGCPIAYAVVITSGREDGPRRLTALRELLAAIPRTPLDERLRERVEALESHALGLTIERAYGLRISHAAVGPELEAMFHSFAMRVSFVAEHAPERHLGPFEKTRDRLFEQPLYGPGELSWKSWDRLEARITDGDRGAGVVRVDPGSCFGLRAMIGDWRDPEGHGVMTIEVKPEPPGPFDFAGWPE